MQCNVSPHVLVKIADLAIQTIDERNPVFGGSLRLKTVRDGLEVGISGAGTDVNVKIPLEEKDILEQGNLIVQYSNLKETLMKFYGQNEVLLGTTRNGQGVVSANDKHLKLNPTVGDFFSIKDNDDTAIPVKLAKKDLLFMLDNTMGSISNQDLTRKGLEGLLLRFDNNELTSVATDGRRLSLAKTKIDVDSSLSTNALISKKTAMALKRLVGKPDDIDGVRDINLDLKENSIQARLAHRIHDTKGGYADVDVTVNTLLLDEKYPDYKRLLDVDFSHVVELDAKNLIDLIDKVSTKDMTSSVKDKNINLTFMPDGMVFVRDEKLNNTKENSESMAVKFNQDKSYEISFNLPYLKNALNFAKEETIRMTFNDKDAGVVITSPSNDSVVQLVARRKT